MTKILIKKANPEELLDLVDDLDQIIGQVTRSVANSDPAKIHREVGIILIKKTGNDDFKFLWQKRSKYKLVGPGKWSITAGHITQGHDPEQTAHTELQEELGFDTDLVFLTKRLNQHPLETHFMHYYLGLYRDEQISIEEAELEKTALLSLAELEEMVGGGEDVNIIHLPLLKEILAGQYQGQIERLNHAHS